MICRSPQAQNPEYRFSLGKRFIRWPVPIQCAKTGLVARRVCDCGPLGFGGGTIKLGPRMARMRAPQPVGPPLLGDNHLDLVAGRQSLSGRVGSGWIPREALVLGIPVYRSVASNNGCVRRAGSCHPCLGRLRHPRLAADVCLGLLQVARAIGGGWNGDIGSIPSS